MLLLHHKGAKSGTERVNPVAYQRSTTGYAIFASRPAPDEPRLVPQPSRQSRHDRGDRRRRHLGACRGRRRRRAREIWSKQKANIRQLRGYEDKTDRQIPVIILEPR